MGQGFEDRGVTKVVENGIAAILSEEEVGEGDVHAEINGEVRDVGVHLTRAPEQGMLDSFGEAWTAGVGAIARAFGVDPAVEVAKPPVVGDGMNEVGGVLALRGVISEGFAQETPLGAP